MLLAASSARALVPVSIETDWNEKTVQFSTFGVTSFTADVGGFGGAGFAVLGSSYVANGVDGSTFGASVLVTSTTKNVVLFDYSIVSTNSFSYQIVQTLKTPTNALYVPVQSTVTIPGVGVNTFSAQSAFSSAYYFSTPQISTSSLISYPASGLVVPIVFPPMRAKVENPVFLLSSLNKGSTYYLTVDYGTYRAP